MTQATDWLVRVYELEEGDPTDSWTIHNRTEDEARREAISDVIASYPSAADWTLTKVKS